MRTLYNYVDRWLIQKGRFTEERVQGIKQILGLPEQVVPLCVVSLGYPAARPEPPARRYDASRLHHNRW